MATLEEKMEDVKISGDKKPAKNKKEGKKQEILRGGSVAKKTNATRLLKMHPPVSKSSRGRNSQMHLG